MQTNILPLQWEYKHIFIQPNTVITDILNDAGAEGWECYAMNFTDVGTQCFCKRVKVDAN